MIDTFFGSLWWLIVSLGILVTFHEFGHFWVARRFGVKVERFSVGFGRALWKRRAADGTEYQVAVVPLGGYVKMLDEREGEVAPADLPRAFNRQRLGARIAIVAAGPVFNLILCLGLLWLMFVVGKPEFQPLVGRSEGIAAVAGLEPGDRLVEIDGEPLRTWSEALQSLALAASDRKPVQAVVENQRGGRRTAILELQRLPEDFDERGLLQAIGLTPRHWLLAARLGKVEPGSGAEAAGLRPGDLIVAIGGQAIADYSQIAPTLQQAMAAGGPTQVRVERDGQRLEFAVTPQRVEDDGQAHWVLGVRPVPNEYDIVLRYGPLDAVGAAGAEAWRLGGQTFAMLWRMVSGRASLQNLSGPISIAQYAHFSAQLGLAWFLSFLALLSLSLAIINLLPIPILDGGHLLYYLIESIKGSPVSDKTLAAGQYIGLALLVGLMGLAFYNDLLRLFG